MQLDAKPITPDLGVFVQNSAEEFLALGMPGQILEASERRKPLGAAAG